MTNFIQEIPELFIQFLLTAVFSFLIGLDQRKQQSEKEDQQTFGTDRTFLFIGLLGFVLLISQPENLVPYLVGAAIISLFLAIFYYQKIRFQNSYGLTTVLLALLTYVIPLIVITQPNWLTMLFFVLVLVLSESKSKIKGFSKKIDRSEFITVAKFILIVGIILPALPDKQILTFLNLSPYKVWLAVVVISGISYLSYILRKFVFPNAGLLLTGVFGGLYSSTATTIILSRKSKETDSNPKEYAAAILIATSMMFLRIFILLFIFNPEVGKTIIHWFILMFILSLIIALYYSGRFKKEKNNETAAVNILEDKNPLEFKVAIVFALLYVLFSFITQFTLENFGSNGLNILSFIVGVTDIDPFLLNLFQGKYEVTKLLIGIATFQAILSNNILKMLYAKVIGVNTMWKYIFRGFAIIIVVNLAVVLILHFL